MKIEDIIKELKQKRFFKKGTVWLFKNYNVCFKTTNFYFAEEGRVVNEIKIDLEYQAESKYKNTLNLILFNFDGHENIKNNKGVETDGG